MPPSPISWRSLYRPAMTVSMGRGPSPARWPTVGPSAWVSPGGGARRRAGWRRMRRRWPRGRRRGAGRGRRAAGRRRRAGRRAGRAARRRRRPRGRGTPRRSAGSSRSMAAWNRALTRAGSIAMRVSSGKGVSPHGVNSRRTVSRGRQFFGRRAKVGGGCPGPGGRQGETHGESRTGARGRLEVDRPAVVLDDPVAHRQAQAGPLADRLGGEERVEDLVADRRLDARAVVGDLDLDRSPRARGSRPRPGRPAGRRRSRWR